MSIFRSLVVLASFFYLVAGKDSSSVPERSRCPAPSQSNPGTWTTYHDIERLSWCNSPMLLDFAVYNPLEDPKTHITIRATTSVTNTDKLDITLSVEPEYKKVTLQLLSLVDNPGRSADNHGENVKSAAKLVQTFWQADSNSNMTSIFATAGNTSVGVYAGSMIQKSITTLAIAQKFMDYLQDKAVNGLVLLQYCGANSDHMFGIVADTSLDSLPKVQRVIRRWSDGICERDGNISDWVDEVIYVKTEPGPRQPTPVNATSEVIHPGFVAKFQQKFQANGPQKPLGSASVLTVCSTVQVASGDSCASLATKCKVLPADFTKYNPSPTFCSSLAVGQYACCSAGSLPDLTPRPNADGSCATYNVLSGDFCAKIAAANGITLATIESLNKNTWGWMGCTNIQIGQLICISTGRAPLPAAVTSAICGPQVPGTTMPNTTTTLASLHPCPLKACCNIWGQCGTVNEFCTISQSITGAPGTAAPGSSGCISNCGTAIVNNASPPKSFKSITYYEAWSMDRPCLNMEVNEIDTTKYTHIHFSFALVSPDYKVDVSAVQNQFDKLVKMKGIKRILSFGGWSFSTSQDSYPIFRESVSNQIRMAFANEVAAFIRDHDLDGVDFDWEYPGAPDIPGLPPGSPNDGINYLSFLKLVRGVLPAEKTVSIAAPASYWYLKGFPIKEIAEVVDYIIYMTYDLHGQWDYGSPWASPGCTSGACLRSHVNLTETINGLSMITKAGVPASKVIVGVSSYGRSFKMLQAGCIGPNCLFVGPASEAAPGACTRTPGYIADGEIARIAASNPSAQNYHDVASDSNILVYDSTQWVAYMDAKTKAGRVAQYKTLNFGGTSDWAVDLAGYAVDDPITTQDCTKWIGLTIDDLIRYRDQESIPHYCIDAIVITAQSNALNEALVNYDKMLANEYDKKFETYASFIKILVPLRMNEWMAEHGSDHFDCSITKHVTCCHDCTSFCSPCDNSPNCKQGIQAVPVPCPSVFPDGPGIHQSLEKYTFTVKNLDAFRQALSTATSIPTEWFVLGDFLAGIDPSCAGGGPASDTCEAKIYWHGVPVPTAFTIPNPKAYITPRPNDLRPFARLLDDASMNVRHYIYGENTGKVIAAATLPIIMMKYALESMALVDRTASAVEHDRLKYSIACFISAILILIPAVGEVLEATEITALVGFGAEVSTAGEAADHIVVLMSLLQDPKSWYKELFAAIIEIPLGEGGETMEVASGIYLSRGQSNIAGLGLNVTNEVGKIQRMREFCSFSET